jgi:predicted transcriptional regulator
MSSWTSHFNAHAPTPGRLGPLERRVLEALWACGTEASVRDLQPRFPDTAYTTLMTTLDRLHRKGALVRTKRGRAFLYRPELSRVEFDSARAADALRSALETKGASLAPMLSFLVDAVGDRSAELLDELEALVRKHRGERSAKS